MAKKVVLAMMPDRRFEGREFFPPPLPPSAPRVVTWSSRRSSVPHHHEGRGTVRKR